MMSRTASAPTAGNGGGHIPSECLKTCMCPHCLPCDIDCDGKEDAVDLVSVFQAADDPHNEIDLGDLAADVDGDRAVDLHGSTDVIIHLTNKRGAEQVEPFSPTWFDNHEINWGQDPSGRCLKSCQAAGKRSKEIWITSVCSRLAIAACASGQNHTMAGMPTDSHAIQMKDMPSQTTPTGGNVNHHWMVQKVCSRCQMQQECRCASEPEEKRLVDSWHWA